MEMMVEAGMTPTKVLVAATGGAAKVMKIDDQVGTLRPGRQADLLVLGANPAQGYPQHPQPGAGLDRRAQDRLKSNTDPA